MAGLKISRRVGEGFSAFVNGIEIKVILEQIKGTRVGVLRIIAPKSVNIFRDELLEGSTNGGIPGPVVPKQAVPSQAAQSVSAAIQGPDVG